VREQYLFKAFPRTSERHDHFRALSGCQQQHKTLYSLSFNKFCKKFGNFRERRHGGNSICSESPVFFGSAGSSPAIAYVRRERLHYPAARDDIQARPCNVTWGAESAGSGPHFPSGA
jgi:hypothetical protein